MGLFQHAHNFTLSESQFIDQSKHTTGPRTGIDILFESSAPEASYDSSARRHVPLCLTGTREQHIKDIADWAVPSSDLISVPPIFRMEGPAGVGKSTIAHSCAERLDDTGNLGASFFFMSNICEDHTCFFPTIAYQLSTRLPDYRELLDKKIKVDPTLVKKQLRYQFRDLITRPFSELQKAGKEVGTYIVLVDGLNECKDIDAQREIVDIIARGISSPTTPLRWAIFSRPEPQIETAFAGSTITAICHSVLLPVPYELGGELALHPRDNFRNTLRRGADLVNPNVVTNGNSVDFARSEPDMPSQSDSIGCPQHQESGSIGEEIVGTEDTVVLHLYPIDDSFIPRHISLLAGQRAKICRETDSKTAPGENNGFFASMVLSTHHAEIWLDNGKIFIKDVKSVNGTYVNGERLSSGGVESDPYELKVDDLVEFGIDITDKDNKTTIHHKVSARAAFVFPERDPQPYPTLTGAAQPVSHPSFQFNLVGDPEEQQTAKNVDQKIPGFEGATALYLYPLYNSCIAKRISLPAGQRVKIGRQIGPKSAPDENNGFFSSKVLSTHHAEIWEDNGKIFIKDVKSSNGTFINGKRLSQKGMESDPHKLNSDDIVEFGVNVVGIDNESFIYHKVVVRAVCVFSEKDAQDAARVEQQQQQQNPDALMGPSQSGPNTPLTPEQRCPSPNVGIGDTPTLYLYPIYDSFTAKRISLPTGQHVKIGRHTGPKSAPGENNGFFASRVLSTQHAEIWEDDGKIFIQDVKSSNGTFVNGERLSPAGVESDPRGLESDDIVELGVDIVDKDNKTTIHHRITARAVCVFSKSDAQVAARAEQTVDTTHSPTLN